MQNELFARLRYTAIEDEKSTQLDKVTTAELQSSQLARHSVYLSIPIRLLDVSDHWERVTVC
jgi:hypothetical protein